MLGEPFLGEAGRLLNRLIEICLRQGCHEAEEGEEHDIEFSSNLTEEQLCDKAVKRGDYWSTLQAVQATQDKYPSPKIGITNTIACIPWKIEKFVKSGVRPPTKIEALACRPRLMDILNIAQPKGIICLGREAAHFIPKPKEGLPSSIKFIEEVIHPSAMLRLERDDPVKFGEVRNRTILTLIRAKRRFWGLETD